MEGGGLDPCLVAIDDLLGGHVVGKLGGEAGGVGQLVERLEPRSVMFTAGAGMLLTSHPASVQVAGEFYSAFQKLITEFIAFTRTGFITLMLNNVATCRNIANNLGRYATTPPLDVLRDAYKGRPAVLVAAGPSLAKNMHLLHELIEGEGGSGNSIVGSKRRSSTMRLSTTNWQPIRN